MVVAMLLSVWNYLLSLSFELIVPIDWLITNFNYHTMFCSTWLVKQITINHKPWFTNHSNHWIKMNPSKLCLSQWVTLVTLRSKWIHAHVMSCHDSSWNAVCSYVCIILHAEGFPLSYKLSSDIQQCLWLPTIEDWRHLLISSLSFCPQPSCI